MYRFLLRPRWIAGHVLLLVTVIAFVNLGLWQLRRLDERQAFNARVAERLAAAPRPLDAVRDEVADDVERLEYRRVSVSGSYGAGEQILTAPRAIDGRPGQQVLTVLERDGRRDLLVDRGWIPFDSRSAQVPPAPPGTVRLQGVVRDREPGDSGRADQVAQIVPTQIAERLSRSLEPFYVQLQSQQPSVAGAPVPTPLPELTEGSHLSYALQWFSFALVALIGYPALVWRTARDAGRPPGTAPTHTGGRDVSVPSATRR